MASHKNSEHHIVPSSRGGRQTCGLPENFHEAWHQCFQNLTPDEILNFVKKIQDLMYSRQRITWDDINILLDAVKED
jgi:hypothetical protein